MQKRRWLPKSNTKTEVVDPVTRHLLSREHAEHMQEVEKVKKSEYNSRMGERRAREELEDLQVRTQEAVEAAELRYESELEELRGEIEALKKEVTRLRLKAHVRRDPSKVQYAVQKAIKHDNVV